MSPGFLDVSLLGLAHPVLDLGEGLLDRIQVGGIFRQEPQSRANRPDGIADGLGFV